MENKWKKTVQLRDIINQFDNNADEKLEVLRIKKLFIERLKKYPDLVDFTKLFNRVTTKDGFNKKLNELYNYCDTFNIWVDL